MRLLFAYKEWGDESETISSSLENHLSSDRPYFKLDNVCFSGLQERLRLEAANVIVLLLASPKDTYSVTQARSCCPDSVVVCLGAVDEEAEMQCFQAGADDVIPGSVRIITARIKQHLTRRLQQSRSPKGQLSHSGAYKYGDLIIDPSRKSIRKNGVDIKLTKRQFEVLRFFTKRHGYTVSREQLLDNCWSDNLNVSDRTVDTCIKILRAKLGSDLVETIYGVGYVMRLPK